tara:strand:- start:1300 stop:2352 length:1053 start_codon:yes stop_codon:yes gene_type:complete
LIFCISLFINYLFSTDQENSLPRTIKSLAYLILIIELKNFIKTHQILFERKIIKYWLLIFLIVLFDIIFEIVFGSNILGFQSYYPGRIASFFNDELVVGGFFLTFSLITITYLLQIRKISKIQMTIYIVLLIIISYLIGERSNFIKFLLAVIIFSLIVLKPKFKEFMGIILIITILIFTFSYLKSTYATRYYHTLSQIFIEKDLNKYLENSQYGAHYNGAYKVFKSYPIFGVGLKNFRNEVYKEKYKNNDYLLTNQRWATHPHQIHYEFLSETGLFGYIIFLIFIISSIIISLKNYLINKNNFQLSSILITVVSVIPLLPSGSFFSTFAGGLFWVNYAVMVSYNKREKIT